MEAPTSSHYQESASFGKLTSIRYLVFPDLVSG